MRFDKLETAYHRIQTSRVVETAKRISRREPSLVGFVVPDPDDLVIGSGRQLSLAIMFLDISGFSSISAISQEQQETVLNTLSLFFTEMCRIVEEYGGTVEKNTGDGLLAYFEKGSAAEGVSATQRAVACALTMMYTQEQLINPACQILSWPRFKFRITIDYGFVTVSRLGAPRRFNTITVIGNTANFTAKLLELAEAGQILLGESAFKQLPWEWSQWCIPLLRPTGWHNTATREAYLAYVYDGRWTGPL